MRRHLSIAAGAALGSLALVAFGLVIWLLISLCPDLFLATVVWIVVAVLSWWARRAV